MTEAAARIRYNLGRLVDEYAGRTGVDTADAVLWVAIAAWPPPHRLSRAGASLARKACKRRLARYMDGEVTPTLDALDDLARALEVDPEEFMRHPSN